MISSFLKSSSLYFAANAISKLVTFSFWIYLARVLSMEEMGKWALLNVFVTVITFFMSLELNSGFNRFYLEFTDAKRRREFEFSFINLLILVNVALALLLSLGKPLADWAVFPMEKSLFLILLSMPLTSTLAGIYLCKLRLENRVMTVLVVSLLQAVLYVGVSYIALRSGMDKLQAVFLGLLAQNLVPLGFYAVDLRVYRLTMDFTALRSSISFSLYLFPSLFGAYLSILAGKYLLGKLGDAASLGIMEANGKITMILGMFMDPLYQATTPIIYRHYKEAGFDRRYRHLMSINSFVLLGLSLPFGIFSPELVRILAGQQYAAYSGIVFPLLMVSIFSFLSRYLAINEHLAKKTQYDMIPELGSGILNIALSIILIRKYGIWGSVAALTATYFFRFIVYLVFAKIFFPSLFVGYRFFILFIAGSILLLGLNHGLSGAGPALKAAVCLAEYAVLLLIFLRVAELGPRQTVEMLNRLLMRKAKAPV